MTFQERRAAIMTRYEQDKKDLESLNQDIEREMLENDAKLHSIMARNRDLGELKRLNSSSIKSLSQFFK